MSKAQLRAGVAIELFNEPYKLSEQTPDGTWILIHEKSRRPLERTPEQLYDHYAARALSFVRLPTPSIAGARRLEKEAADGLSEDELKVFRYRLKFARAAQGVPHSRKALESVIAEVWYDLPAEQIPDSVPGYVSVYRWASAYSNSGGDPRSLLSNHARKGNREDRYPDEVLQVCEEEIENTYLKLERPALTYVLELAQGLVRRLNLQRSPNSQLPKPSLKLLDRLLKKNHSAYDICVRRYGRDAANAKFRSVLHMRVTSAALQRGEIDHTRLDLMAIDDDTGMPLGRPWVTLLIDRHTRCILGMCISFEPPSSSTVAQCIRHAFMPKVSMREEYNLKNEWDQFGVVSELVMDGGSEFYTEGLEQVLLELDVDPHWAPRRTPWFKGTIERYNKTQNTATTAAVPGKTFTNIFERDEYDPKKHAVMPMSAIRQLIYKWICDVYHQKEHSALGCSPAQKWRQSLRPHDVAVMADPDRVEALVGIPIERKLDHSGITYLGLRYNSPALVELRRQLGPELKKVDVRINRSDLGSVVVLHPVTKVPLRARCLLFEYADGLTEWQHKLCQKYAADRGWDTEDPDAWLDALLEIHELVKSQSAIWGRKVRDGQRIGRWKEARSKKKARKQTQAEPASISTEQPATQATPAPRKRPAQPKKTRAERQVEVDGDLPVRHPVAEPPGVDPARRGGRKRFVAEISA